MRKFHFTALCVLLCVACNSSQKNGEERKDEIDSTAVHELQGIWLDDNTELPLFKIKGDSIYYASQINLPMSLR